MASRLMKMYGTKLGLESAEIDEVTPVVVGDAPVVSKEPVVVEEPAVVEAVVPALENAEPVVAEPEPAVVEEPAVVAEVPVEPVVAEAAPAEPVVADVPAAVVAEPVVVEEPEVAEAAPVEPVEAPAPVVIEPVVADAEPVVAPVETPALGEPDAEPVTAELPQIVAVVEGGEGSMEDQVIEVMTAADEADTSVAEVSEMQDIKTSIESIRATLEESMADGGVDQQTAGIMNQFVEEQAERLGMDVPPTIATESFGGTQTRAHATRLSMESLSDMLRQLWEAIKRAIAKAVQALAIYFSTVIRAGKAIEGRGKELDKLVAKCSFKEIEDFKMPGNPETSEALAVCVEGIDRTVTRLAELVRVGSEVYVPAFYAYREEIAKIIAEMDGASAESVNNGLGKISALATPVLNDYLSFRFSELQFNIGLEVMEHGQFRCEVATLVKETSSHQTGGVFERLSRESLTAATGKLSVIGTRSAALAESIIRAKKGDLIKPVSDLITAAAKAELDEPVRKDVADLLAFVEGISLYPDVFARALSSEAVSIARKVSIGVEINLRSYE